MDTTQPNRTEIIAFASGKGGTGKTLTAVCLAYALVRAGHSVLAIDADAGTDGLSLFLLGPRGARQISDFESASTFVGALRAFAATGSMTIEPRGIHRIASQDHGVTYEAMISTNRIYGDSVEEQPVVPDLDRASFRKGIAALFNAVRKKSYDYVIVDTRGGFAFESTDVCACADSFIVVTEPDFTSFYQDRNLLKHINAAAATLGTKPLMRSIIVNKATDGRAPGTQIDLGVLEQSFRLELTKEFPIKFENTHAVPIDIEAVEAYKKQQVPYLAAPGSAFSFATLSAFGDILQVVTAPWPQDRVVRWNELVESVSQAVERRDRERVEKNWREAAVVEEMESLRKHNVELDRHVAQLTRELDRAHEQNQREYERTEQLVERIDKRGDRVAADVAPRLSRRSVFARVSLLLVFIATAASGAWYYQSAVLRPRELLQRLYESGPSSLRADYLVELVTRYKQKDFSDLSLRQVSLDNADLSSVVLRGANLEGSSFQYGYVSYANFQRSKLSKADFRKAYLTSADFSDADLTGARFDEAHLEGTDFSGAILDGADFSNAKVSPEQLRKAASLKGIVMPAPSVSTEKPAAK